MLQLRIFIYVDVENFCRPAVSIGNEVLVHENQELTPAEVINISDSKMQVDFYSQTYVIIYSFHAFSNHKQTTNYTHY